MINKKFELESLPDLPDIVDKKTFQIRNKIIDNYFILETNTIKVLDYCINNGIMKSLIFYNLFYYVEICLKLKLALDCLLSLEDIENLGHNIYEMMNKISEINFIGFKYILRRLKDKNNQNLNFSKYSDFRYNKSIGTDYLIFDNKFTDNDEKYVRDVIEWLDSHMVI